MLKTANKLCSVISLITDKRLESIKLSILSIDDRQVVGSTGELSISLECYIYYPSDGYSTPPGIS